jgi:hypothetical protein
LARDGINSFILPTIGGLFAVHGVPTRVALPVYAGTGTDLLGTFEAARPRGLLAALIDLMLATFKRRT